jgi:N-hydroxyarylamine O-acetyltransferase
VLDEDGTVDTPANHHTNVVSLDRRYLVDVGLAIPALRRPLPLDGGSRTDGAGITWRLVESDRPDADFLGQYRTPGDGWTDRFVFRDRPRELSYFAASCEYLANAPESAFTGEPLVTIATDDGHYKLTRETLVFAREDERQTERPVADDEYHDTLESVFGLSV